MKDDKSKNFSRYGLYEYIGQEKRAEKKLQKKWHVNISRISRFFGEFQLCGLFFEQFYIIKSDKSKNISRYGLYEYIGEETRVKKITKKNGM